jgi:hypothetical protein
VLLHQVVEVLLVALDVRRPVAALHHKLHLLKNKIRRLLIGWAKLESGIFASFLVQVDVVMDINNLGHCLQGLHR